jgi:hypothetical protein
LALGVSALNLGGQIKTGTLNENLPLTYTGGIAFYVVPDKLTLAADAEKPRDTDVILHLGTEYVFQGRYLLRAGYQDTKEAKGGLSAGLGYIWRPRSESSNDFFGKQDTKVKNDGVDIRIDYAFVDMGDLDGTHRLGLHLSF